MSRKIAYIFPGQGAQYVGMGRDLYEKSAAAKEIFEKANRILGISLTDICFFGTQEQLKSTDICQLAIFTTSIASLQALKECSNANISPDFCAGLSLGEYSALVASGVLSFEDALSLVRRRGQFMEEAASEQDGKMAAIIGLDEEKVRKLADELGLCIANLNCPGQIVISGQAKKIEAACLVAKERGALQAITLEVSGAFHSPFMNEASLRLGKELSKYTISKPLVDIVFNASSAPATTPEAIKKNLVAQITSSVLWDSSMRHIINEGVTIFLEMGPGKVLRGLLRRIDSNVETLNISNKSDIESTVDKLTNNLCCNKP